MKNYAYLIQVNAAANNNKFYEIIEQDNGTIDVRYGRVGVSSMEKHYGYEKTFYGLKREKESKGYEDRTALHSETDRKDDSLVQELSYKSIENERVSKLFDVLINSSRDFMKRNYTVTAVQITDKMVKEAEADIDRLNRIALMKQPNALYEFNRQLQELFTDIPRNMKTVEAYLAKTEADFEKIIARETEMLDNVKGIVVQKSESNVDKDQTVLEANGLVVRPVTYKEEDQILSHLGVDYDGRSIENRYIQGFAVENKATREKYEAYKERHNMKAKDVRLFYHGSKVENWHSIIKRGLSLNPNATTTGKMFGQGLYFAPECRKSLNYMDVKGSHWNSGSRETGYCAVYAVALGKCYQPDYILGDNFRKSDLPYGTNSVFAGKNNPHLHLRNDEYVVYDQAACTIKYLLEMSSQNVRTKQYSIDRSVVRDNLSDGLDELVKTAKGVKAELNLNRLPSAVQSELSSKINGLPDYQSICIDYNANTGYIALVGVRLDGTEERVVSTLTNDDYAFLAREMKKTFMVSEDAWENLIETTSNYPIGEKVADKSGIAEGDGKRTAEKQKKDDFSAEK